MTRSLGKQLCRAGSAFAALLLAPAAGLAAEIGHFAPGLVNIRDYIVPEPGFYSQYLPLTSDQTALLEIGPWGYSSWQVTRDEGSDANPGGVRDQVHAVGGQLGLSYVPWTVALNAHYAYEFHSEDRFQGHSAGISLAIGFGTASEAH